MNISEAQLSALKDGCIDALVDRPQLIDVVDRDIYDLIIKEQAIQQVTKSDATQGGIGVGGGHILTAEIVAYKNWFDTKITDKNIYKSTIKLDINITSIETGEVIFSKIFEVGGSTEFMNAKPSENDKKVAQQKNFKQATSFLTKWVRLELFHVLTPPIYILEEMKSEKERTKTVMISAGSQAGLKSGHQIEVIETTTESIDGQALNREIIIAKLKVDNAHPITSVCSVKKGEHELHAAITLGKSLHCRIIKPEALLILD